jgi:hypothetical protein
MSHAVVPTDDYPNGYAQLAEPLSFVDDGSVYVSLNIRLNIGKMHMFLTFPIVYETTHISILYYYIDLSDKP